MKITINGIRLQLKAKKNTWLVYPLPAMLPLYMEWHFHKKRWAFIHPQLPEELRAIEKDLAAYIATLPRKR